MPTSYSEFTNLCNYCVSKKSLCNLKANTFCILKSNYVGKQGKKNLAKFVFSNRRQCNKEFKWKQRPVCKVSNF